jgi:BioD-like phosphotransacetylase family protein
VAAPSGDSVLVVEADLATASSLPAATVILVARTVAPKSLPAGLVVKAVVVTAVPAAGLSAIPATVGGVPVIALPEDRTLAGFSVSEARSLLNAEVLVPGEDGDPTCDHLVISPIASDAGQPYFRRFPAQAVVVRFDKTDMHLAAMRAQPQCLILTGGRRPSDYLFDAASASGVPVLLSRTDTENTVIALEGVFDHTRFQGERKLDRMDTLLEGSQLYGGLA